MRGGVGTGLGRYLDGIEREILLLVGCLFWMWVWKFGMIPLFFSLAGFKDLSTV